MVAVSIKTAAPAFQGGNSTAVRPLYKSDTSRSMDKSGVGLGLHIVKSTLHIMGAILVKTVEGIQRLYLSLPAHRDKPAVLLPQGR